MMNPTVEIAPAGLDHDAGDMTTPMLQSSDHVGGIENGEEYNPNVTSIDRNNNTTDSINRNNNNFRGGWTTSICGLFQDPTRRSDFCAITCCGVLLMDRNEYLLSRFRGTEEEEEDGVHVGDIGVRPNWKRRCFFSFALPLILLCTILLLVTPEGTNSLLIGILQLALLVWAIVLLYKGRVQRSKIRKQVLAKLFMEQEGQYQDTHDYDHVRRAAMMDAENATAVCCSHRKDQVSNTSSSDRMQQLQPQDGTTPGSGGHADLGSCLWNSIAAACCGACCGCWLQCCGSCATNQENVEIERLLLEEDPDNRFLLHIDYITFQPFRDYYTRILNLRRMGPASTAVQEWTAQWDALSDLSRHILRWFVGAVLALGILSAFSGVEGLLAYLVSIIGTTAHSILILYLVHWRWNRSDISADAIIKYTASGFVLAFFMGWVVEQILMMMLSPVVVVFIIFDIVTVDTHGVPLDKWILDPSNLQEMARGHLGQLAVFAVVLSFLIAAFTEELMKYYTYWMTETPDLKTSSELGMTASPSGAADPAIAIEVDSKIRRARATTIAMVAVATGFAWSENVLYVRLQHGVRNMFITLVARGLLPVHELCGALQSIGVVRRDIELHSQWQMGRSVLSAVLVHGLYDFALIFGSIVTAVTTDLDPNEKGGGIIIDPDQPIDVMEAIVSISYGIPILLLGIWYYIVEARKQRLRLQAVEGYTDMRGTSSTLEWVVDDESNNNNSNNCDDDVSGGFSTPRRMDDEEQP